MNFFSSCVSKHYIKLISLLSLTPPPPHTHTHKSSIFCMSFSAQAVFACWAISTIAITISMLQAEAWLVSGMAWHGMAWHGMAWQPII